MLKIRANKIREKSFFYYFSEIFNIHLKSCKCFESFKRSFHGYVVT